MNDKANAEAMPGNATATTGNAIARDATAGKNAEGKRATAAVSRFILRRFLRMTPIIVGVGLALGFLAATAVYFLEKYDYLIFKDGGKHHFVIEGRRISIDIPSDSLERVRGFVAQLENVSLALVVTAVLLGVMIVGAVAQAADAAVRTRTYLSAGFSRRSALLAHARSFGFGTAVAGALAVAGVAIHGLTSNDFSGSFRLTGVWHGQTARTYEANLWALALAATVAVAGAYAAAYGIFMAFVRLPWYAAGIAVVAVLSAWSSLRWVSVATGASEGRLHTLPFAPIGPSGLPFWHPLWDLASIVFYAAVAWLCMRRIQVRR